jgi:hypothetical protein
MNSATSNAVISRFGSPLFAGEMSAGACVVSAVCADSLHVVLLIGTLRTCGVERMVDAWFSGLANRVGMVRREDDRHQAIGSRGELGYGGIQSVSLNARSNRRGTGEWR